MLVCFFSWDIYMEHFKYCNVSGFFSRGIYMKSFKYCNVRGDFPRGIYMERFKYCNVSVIFPGVLIWNDLPNDTEAGNSCRRRVPLVTVCSSSITRVLIS